MRCLLKVNGKHCYLWRAVDREGEVLEALVTARRDKAAALKLLKRIMKNTGLLAASSPMGFGHIRRRSTRSVLPSGTRSAVGSTIAQRTRISRFDDANGLCSAFEA